MKLTKFISMTLLCTGLFLTSLFAQAEPQLSKEFALVNPPQAVETGKKIEVLEIFWYGCPHCSDLEAPLSAWVKKLPGDVTFRRMPAIFRDNWAPMAKAYYTFEALNEVEKLHSALFHAIHTQGLDPTNETTLFDWVVKQGVDKKKFTDTYLSFAIQSKVLRAKQLTREYGITGVPSLIIDGKYVTSSSMTGGHQGLFTTVDFLIAKARKERAGKK